MATYNELRSLFSHGDLRNRTEVALCIKVHSILAEEAPSAERMAWARGVLNNSYGEADALLKYALASAAALTPVQIMAVSDADLLAAVGAAVDKLYP